MISLLVRSLITLGLICFLFACAQESKETLEELPINSPSYFLQIKANSNVFTTELGDSFKDSSFNEILHKNDYYEVIYQSTNSEITAIRLNVVIQDPALRKELLFDIISHFNEKHQANKTNLNFSSWHFTNEKKRPVEILLINTKSEDRINLYISYRN